jgi:putative radical SAM enzyme (TIGR03279 family)
MTRAATNAMAHFRPSYPHNAKARCRDAAPDAVNLDANPADAPTVDLDANPAAAATAVDANPADTVVATAASVNPADTAAAAASANPVAALIAAVDAGSPAATAGLMPGNRVLAVDGQPLTDIIDWLWLTDGPSITLDVTAGDSAGLLPQVQRISLKRHPGDSWGITFSDPLFDGLRICRNACPFCFMTMLPAGMRPSLYLRDDDYRLSFLQGNFVTLTNLSDADLQRIVGYRLSPLHVSLHAASPGARRQLLGKNQGRGLEALEFLLAAGIQVQAQIVLLPGVNDGDELDRTLRWVEARPGISTVGIVPYGYTKYARIGQGFDSDAAQRLIAQLAPYQQRAQVESGMTRFQLADEWFLLAGQPVPLASYYDGYPQYQDGIGMLRAFIDDWQQYAASGNGRDGLVTEVSSSIVLVTGEAFAPTLRQLAAELEPSLSVLAVENRFFGGNVDVAGLLTAEDIVHSINQQRLPSGVKIVLPDVVFNSDGLTLDDKRADDIAAALQRQVFVVPCTVEAIINALEQCEFTDCSSGRPT